MPNVGKPAEKDVPGPPKHGNGSDDSTSVGPVVDPGEIVGSMNTEEPLGWDQAPKDIKNPREKRHSRPDGVGGIKPSEHPDRASDNL